MEQEKKYQELEQDIIDFFKKTEREFNMPVDMRYVFQSVSTQKELIKITKIPEHLVDFVNGDILVQINPIYFDSFDETTNKILFEEKIDYICFNMDKGTIKLVKPKLTVGSGIGHKHGFENVMNAKEAEKALIAQLKEKEKELEGK